MTDDRGRARRAGILGAGLLAAASLAAAAGTARIPSFGADVGVVRLSLAITDPQDRPVGDLSPADIEVFEDGVRQEISLFTRERLPISLTLLVDGSTSMNAKLPVAKAAAVRFIRALGAEDDAQVVQFTRHYAVLQEPTSDTAALEAAVGGIAAGGETSLFSTIYIALRELSRRPAAEDPWRRRAVVVLTDGEDTASLVSDDQLLDLARRDGVGVYAIGLFGPRSPLDEGPDPTYFLNALARETGGRAYFPRALDELDGAYARIAEELRTLYGVGYVPSNPRRDGKWRRVSIATVRPSLLVRHRLGYPGPSEARLPRLAAGR